MKIKSDFVTNSSSSSFIVAFPKRIRTEEHVKPFIPHKYYKTVFQDALQQKPFIHPSEKLLKKTIDEISHGYVIGTPDVNYWDQDRQFANRENVDKETFDKHPEWRTIMWDEHRLIQNGNNRNLAVQFLEGIPNGYYVYLFSYADDSGEYFAEMEHNDIFRELPRLQISHH